MNNNQPTNSGTSSSYRMRNNGLVVLLLWIITIALIYQSIALYIALEENEKIQNYYRSPGLYHVKMEAHPFENNSVFLPFPIWQRDNKIVDEVFNNMKIIDGNCSYRLVSTEYGPALLINFTSAFEISSNYLVNVSKTNGNGIFNIGLSLKAKNITNEYYRMYENYYVKIIIFNEVKIVSIHFESRIPVSLTNQKFNGYTSYINSSSSNNSWVVTGFKFEELSINTTESMRFFPDCWILTTAILIILIILFTVIFIRNRKNLKR